MTRAASARAICRSGQKVTNLMTWRFFLTAASLLLITGCADPYQVASETKPQGTAFNQALYDGYLDLATAARDKDDWADIEYFADKAMASAAGDPVAPDEVEQRDLPLASEPDLIVARRQLIWILEQGAAEVWPADGAEAQVSFDCWMQEQEENRDPKEIETCRSRFDAAMARLEVSITQQAAAAAAASAPQPATLPGPFVVYFDNDSDSLSDEGLQTVRRAVDSASAASASGFILSAPMERVATRDHDFVLLQRRVQSVADALSSSGVFGDQIRFAGYGKSGLETVAGDQQREASNLWVEISLVR
jgi:outer membrane protein OmpA-like peptidoglycan-associated protein